MSFYRIFGHNHPIETIGGYDGKVHRGPFWLSPVVRSLMEQLDEPLEMHYKPP